MSILIGARNIRGPYKRGWQSGAKPGPTITTAPDGEGGAGWIAIGADAAPAQPSAVNGKPPYRVPSMAEIAAIPWNGFTAASTFSGCGGSCLGYRMAGFKILWASDSEPNARESYLANWPGAAMDGRDIRLVKPEEILEAVGMKAGGLDLLDGSPPCVSFSTAGKREAHWGRLKDHAGLRQRTDDLFPEYVRILGGLMPKAFVAENVSGLVKGVAKGFFLETLAALKGCGYRVRARVLDAQWLGVPQMRQRVIFIGLREDLGLDPAFPKPLPYRYSVREALPWIDGVHLNAHEFQPDIEVNADGPMTTVAASGLGSYGYHVRARVIHDTSGLFSQGDVTDRPCPAITAGANGMNACHFKVKSLPPSRQRPNAYGVQDIKPNQPSPTVTIGSPGNDLAVPHGTEKRKFSIAELKRICAFPDDFILAGTYAQQWERLGNAVPPVMMFHIAASVRGLLPAAGGRP